MTRDEQDIVVGRLIRERAEAIRDRAALVWSLNEDARLINKLATSMGREPAEAIAIISEVEEAGGLDGLKSTVGKSVSLTERIAEISKTLQGYCIDLPQAEYK